MREPNDDLLRRAYQPRPESGEKNPELPPYMRRRHEALQKIHRHITEDPKKVRELFNFESTVHADLELSWIDPNFQQQEIGPATEYQIVIATVQPGQTSQAHLHEIGSSSFIVLGPAHGFAAPENLVFRTGKLDFASGQVTNVEEVQCWEGMELDIPAYTVHQFVNNGSEPVRLLIVTHPIISVEEDHSDIHFTPKNKPE